MPSKTKNVERPSTCLFATEIGRAAMEYGVFFAGKSLLKKAPKGNQEPVLVLPGFMATDISTKPLRNFLTKLGYNAIPWELGRNFADYRYVLELVDKVKQLKKEHKQKISIIGWSLGGVYAREVARNAPGAVKQVITMGSPFGGINKENNVSWIYNMISGKSVEDLDPKLIENILTPPPVPVTAIYSKQDGVVNWKYCMELETGPRIQNVEVKGSHLGFGHNLAAFKCIANRLSQSVKTWEPYRPEGWLKETLSPLTSRSFKPA